MGAASAANSQCFLDKFKAIIAKKHLIADEKHWCAECTTFDGDQMFFGIVRYESGVELLRKTPAFYQQVSKDRLQRKFNCAYRYVEVLYEGGNPYVEAIKMNFTHLVRVLKSSEWQLLRRSPSYFLGVTDAIQIMEKLVHKQLATIPRQHAAVPGYVTA